MFTEDFRVSTEISVLPLNCIILLNETAQGKLYKYDYSQARFIFFSLISK